MYIFAPYYNFFIFFIAFGPFLSEISVNRRFHCVIATFV